MTMTSHAPHVPNNTSPTSTITWTSVQPGLWVGKANGEFAGMIEKQSSQGYIATTRLAKKLGVFPTVAAAKASFTS